MGLSFRRERNSYHLPDAGAVVQVSDFPILRNVSVALRGAGDDLCRRFEAALAHYLAARRAQTWSPRSRSGSMESPVNSKPRVTGMGRDTLPSLH